MFVSIFIYTQAFILDTAILNQNIEFISNYSIKFIKRLSIIYNNHFNIIYTYILTFSIEFNCFLFLIFIFLMLIIATAVKKREKIIPPRCSLSYYEVIKIMTNDKGLEKVSNWLKVSREFKSNQWGRTKYGVTFRINSLQIKNFIVTNDFKIAKLILQGIMH